MAGWSRCALRMGLWIAVLVLAVLGCQQSHEPAEDRFDSAHLG